jgi:Tol biopolymer transport system component
MSSDERGGGTMLVLLHKWVRSAIASLARSSKKFKKACVSTWEWFDRQANPLQALIALLALVVAVAAIIVPLAANNNSVPPKPTTTPKPSKPVIRLKQSPRLLVSSNSMNTPANGDSGRPAFSASGRYVVFTSAATNLASASFPLGYEYHNIYLKDRETGTLYWVSAGIGNEPPNGESQFPVICPTGRFVAFASQATNLTQTGPELVGKKWRVYIYDRINNNTYMISFSKNGQDSNGDSDDPQFNADCSSVVFESTSSDLVSGDTNAATDVFVRRLQERKTELVSDNEGRSLNNASFNPAINSDGIMVAFTSYATNLPGAITGEPSVYLMDTRTKKVTNVSAAFKGLATSNEGFSWASFSPDGRYLVFRSLEDKTTQMGGPAVLVWDTKLRRSAILDINGNPTGWTDACTSGINNGTTFSPSVSDPSSGHPYLVMFTVFKGETCQLVLRDFSGADIPINLENGVNEVLEPALDTSGDVIAYDVAGQPQLIYACTLKACTHPST